MLTEKTQNAEKVSSYNQKSARIRVSQLMNDINSTKFFRPDNKPKEEWKIVYGNSWEDAKKKAEKTVKADGFDINQSAQEAQARTMLGVSLRWKGALFSEAIIKDSLEGWVSLIVNPKAFGMPLSYMKAAISAAWNANSSELGWENLWDVAGAAGRVAALATIEMHEPKAVSKEQIKSADEYWEVFKKGYATVGEFGGKLYVYAPQPKEKSQGDLFLDRRF